MPEYYRGFANGVVIAGMKCGPAVGTFAAGLLMAKYGWRPVFVGIGLISLAWLPAWWKWMPRGQAVAESAVSGVTIAAILRERSFWGASAGHFCANYLLYVMVTWLPFYLVHERHLSIEVMAKFAGMYFLVDALSAISCGWLSDLFIRRYTPTFVRKSAMALGNTTAGIGIAACVVCGPHIYLAWLMAAAVGSGMTGSGLYAFAQTLAGPPATGTWTGLQNGFANLAGVIAPALTGLLVNRTGNFLAAFASRLRCRWLAASGGSSPSGDLSRWFGHQNTEVCKRLFETAVAALKPGTQISINYARGTSAHEVSMTVGSKN